MEKCSRGERKKHQIAKNHMEYISLYVKNKLFLCALKYWKLHRKLNNYYQSIESWEGSSLPILYINAENIWFLPLGEKVLKCKVHDIFEHNLHITSLILENNKCLWSEWIWKKEKNNELRR